jgi:Zn-dependent metalloprotease
MANGRSTLSFLTLALIAAPVFGQMSKPATEVLAAVRAQEPTRALASANHLAGLRAALGLNELHTFTARTSHTDEFGSTHVHFQQQYLGVPVFGGAAITHLDRQGNHSEITDSLIRNINVNVTPNLTPAEAVAVAHASLAPKGAYAVAPTSELVIFPVQTLAPKAGLARHADATAFETQTLRSVLAYHVHTSLRNDQETKDTDYIIDAHTGTILKSWNDLHTTAAVGTGISQYSGTVSINTNLNGSSYELKDIVRSMNISTYNMNHATSGTGTLYTDADNSWGDGTNYTGSTTSTTSAKGQTAAVDAHYGIEVTFDFYKNLFARNGIDGAGKATYSKVHYSTSYDNAFWDDTCFCMTYGDGSSFKSLEAPDVAGHEMSHGVCANTANLNYSGESGGLNEANSDMFGNMVELYDHNGMTMPATVANTDGCWTVGEQLSSTPLRYMYKPSLDGSSPDVWSSSVGNLDVHYSSGPANRMFFFLSQGASATSSSPYYSSKAPLGFTGVGPEKAIRIQYKALTTYMTASTNYAAYRTAMMNAASALYGTTGAEYAAVQNAFGAIAVGALAPTGVTVGISPTTASVVVGGTFQFTATVSGSTNTAVTWTATGGTVSTSGLYTAPATAGTYTVKVTSAADTTKSASATVTVTPAGGVAVTITPTTSTLSPGATQQFTAAVTGSTNTAVTWTATGGTVSTSGLYTAPATAGTYTVKATSAADTTKSASATVTVSTSTGTTLAEGFEAGTKTAYAAGSVTFTTGSWTLTDALVGTSTSDPKDGTKSVRVRNSGTVAMGFNFATGAKTVTVKHAKYGTDASSTWGLYYSTDGGTTWTQAGSSVTTSSTTLATATFTVNKTGAIRFQLKKTDGTSSRVNFDTFQINGY